MFWPVIASYSGKVVSFLTLPVKNYVAIYDEIFRYVYTVNIMKCHVHAIYTINQDCTYSQSCIIYL